MLNSYTKGSTLLMVFCFKVVVFFFTNFLHQSLFRTYDLLTSVLLTYNISAVFGLLPACFFGKTYVANRKDLFHSIFRNS